MCTAHTTYVTTLVAVGLALGLTACSGGDDPDSGVAADTGASAPDAAADAGVEVPDSGPADVGMMACDPTDGTGCAAGGNIRCVWVPSIDEVQCRDVFQGLGHEAMCDASNQNCGGGRTCITIDQGVAPTCHQVCNVGGDECEGLQGASPGYYCQGLRAQNGITLKYGICRPIGTACTPLNDMCPQGEVCALLGDVTVCRTAGMTPLGGNCQAAQCQRGGICILLNGTNNARCYQPCDPNNANFMCTEAGTMCNGLMGFDFGICSVP